MDTRTGAEDGDAAERRALARRVERLERRVAELEQALRAATPQGGAPASEEVAPPLPPDAPPPEAASARPPRRASAPPRAGLYDAAERVEGGSLRRLGVSRRGRRRGPVALLGRAALLIVGVVLATALASMVIQWQRQTGGGFGDILGGDIEIIGPPGGFGGEAGGGFGGDAGGGFGGDPGGGFGGDAGGGFGGDAGAGGGEAGGGGGFGGSSGDGGGNGGGTAQ